MSIRERAAVYGAIGGSAALFLLITSGLLVAVMAIGVAVLLAVVQS